MLAFENDYSFGCHPEVLKKLCETNMELLIGYGQDTYSISAAEKIRAACGCPNAKVYFLSGGTQANKVVLNALLRSNECALAAASGHISTHEAGAVETTGHEVLLLPEHEGKIDAGELEAYLLNVENNNGYGQLAVPGAVYISYPTELGTIYSKKELETIYAICKAHDIKLFIDGARLGYGLTSPACDLTLGEFARLCDVFYIGGTKVGALCGEAVVFPDGNEPKHFYVTLKQQGAMLAKGRLAGVQFDALFTDGLYTKIAAIAIETAMRVKKAMVDHGVELWLDSPTNQQFGLLTQQQYDFLRERMRLSYWEPVKDGRIAVRFCTCWCTTAADIDEFNALLDAMPR